jgi:hypothetical protein
LAEFSVVDINISTVSWATEPNLKTPSRTAGQHAICFKCSGLQGGETILALPALHGTALVEGILENRPDPVAMLAISISICDF